MLLAGHLEVIMGTQRNLRGFCGLTRLVLGSAFASAVSSKWPDNRPGVVVLVVQGKGSSISLQVLSLSRRADGTVMPVGTFSTLSSLLA